MQSFPDISWNQLCAINNDRAFLEKAIEIYQHQKQISVYSEFIRLSLGEKALGIKPNVLESIPFLPIGFFKTHQLVIGEFERVFESSGTGDQNTSKHFVKSLELYKKCFETCFEQFYGPVNPWVILGLLPSYLERENSSLVYMVDKLIEQSNKEASGFYLHDYNALARQLKLLETENQPTLLIGVSYALLDFAERYSFQLKNTIIVETGGMKGRRKEITKEAFHGILCDAFHLESIHSEYGMTELLSQAYSKGNGRFFTPPWMKVFIRDLYNPLCVHRKAEVTGAINIIDLANMNSISFIATDDLGRLHPDGSFEVLGRLDDSDIRGCNLMI